MSVPISRRDAIAMRENLQSGRVDLVISALDKVIGPLPSAEKAAELGDDEIGAAIEPGVYHGTLDIGGGEMRAIKVELHPTEGGLFDDDGHAVDGEIDLSDDEAIDRLIEAEDDGFTTVDLSGYRFQTADEGESMPMIHGRIDTKANRVVQSERSDGKTAFEITTVDPRFDPALPLTVNGFAFAPVETEADRKAKHSAAEQRIRDEIANRGKVAHHERFRLLNKPCDRCGSKPVVTFIDGDGLCSPCATKWVLAEGQAERDRIEEGDAHG